MKKQNQRANCKTKGGNQKFTESRTPMTKRNSSKNQRRTKEIIDSVVQQEASKPNPFEWYDGYQEYTKYAGTIPFGKPIGETFNLNTTGTSLTAAQTVIPGVMTISFIPTPGYSADRNSPINRSAIRWYSKLRQLQKASSDYDSQDMMMTFMAIDSLAMFHEIGKRIVGIGNLNSVLNRYMPEGVLTAMHVDPIDVRNNIADWWGYVNKFGIDAGNITMPKDFALRKRHQWMCEGLYTDSATERAQIYVFQPEGFWKYNNTVTTGSQLDWVPYPGTVSKLMTLADYKALGNSLLSAVFGDEDTGTISGDTANAIGWDNCYSYDQIASNYTISALYSEMVLQQIENSFAMGGFASTYTPVISQDPSVNNGAILFKPQLTFTDSSTSGLSVHKTILNFHHSNPTVEDIIEATRLRCAPGSVSTGGVISPTSFGSEIVTTYQIFTAKVDDPQTFVRSGGYGNDIVFGHSVSLTTNLGILAANVAFDWSPILYLVGKDGSTGTDKLFGVSCDYDVTALLDPDQLANMHDAALSSQFKVPENSLDFRPI